MEERKIPQSTFCVNVRLRLQTFLWTQRILQVYVWGPSGTVVKEQGSLGIVSEYEAQRACFKV
jgi:hypothetical protein